MSMCTVINFKSGPITEKTHNINLFNRHFTLTISLISLKPNHSAISINVTDETLQKVPPGYLFRQFTHKEGLDAIL